MRRLLTLLGLLTLPLLAVTPESADSACCYFAAKDKDILQPAQKAFLTFDATEKVETFTVQPKFEGNAADFGMVIPTPSKPKLDEMPREFFKELAVFTILEPMDVQKYKPLRFKGGYDLEKLEKARDPAKEKVKVLEAGVVGSLDYKIITAEKADDLYAWLKENKYSYGGDEATLAFYLDKKWFFTVMKIDPMQMKKRKDGSYEGEITPTRFTFASEKLVYPLKITQLSVKDHTEALFYVQTGHKVDLSGDLSYEPSFATMWSQATGFAEPEKLTREEAEWHKLVQPKVPGLAQKIADIRSKKHEPTTLEWAKKIGTADLDVIEGKKAYNRDAPKEDVEKLKLLRGHVNKDQFLTKLRKVFSKDEMNDDLEFVRARFEGKDDNIEYFSILPTSPP